MCYNLIYYNSLFTDLCGRVCGCPCCGLRYHALWNWWYPGQLRQWKVACFKDEMAFNIRNFIYSLDNYNILSDLG